MAIISSVPLYRPGVASRAFQAGRPVSSAAPEWSTIVALQNWVQSRGASYLPAFRPDHGALPGGSTYSYPTYLRAHGPSIRRVWTATVAGPANPYTLSDGATTSGTLGTAAGSPVTFLSPLSTRETVDQEVALTLDLTSASVAGDAGITNEYVVEQLGCHAEPRGALEDDSVDRGLNPARFRTGSVLSSSNTADLRALTEGEMTSRVLAAWAVPALVDATLSTTYARSGTGGGTFTVWPSFVPALGRKGGRSDTRRQVAARVFYWMSSAEDAGAYVSSVTEGDGNTITLTLDLNGRWSDEMTVDIDAEDLATADGLQGGSFDGVNITIQAPGSATVYVAGAIVYETSVTTSAGGAVSPEAGLTPDYVRTDGTDITLTAAQRSQSFLVAMDATVPAASPEGYMFELGGSAGAYAGFTASGDFRAGTAGIASGSGFTYFGDPGGLDVSATMYGTTGTLYYAMDVSSNELGVWWHPDGGSVILLGYTAAETFAGVQGSNEGAAGQIGGTGSGAGSLGTDVFNGPFTEARFYFNVPFPTVLPTS